MISGAWHNMGSFVWCGAPPSKRCTDILEEAQSDILNPNTYLSSVLNSPGCWSPKYSSIGVPLVWLSCYSDSRWSRPLQIWDEPLPSNTVSKQGSTSSCTALTTISPMTDYCKVINYAAAVASPTDWRRCYYKINGSYFSHIKLLVNKPQYLTFLRKI